MPENVPLSPDPFLQRLYSYFRPDIDAADLDDLILDWRDWQADQKHEAFVSFATAMGQNGAANGLIPTEGKEFELYLDTLETMVGNDVRVLRTSYIRQPLFAIQADPLLCMRWDKFLRSKRLDPVKFWAALQYVEHGGKGPAPLLTAKDFLLDDDENIDWLIDDIVAEGTLVLLAGPPKAGKSTLVRHMLMSVLAGTPFLGRGTHKGKVLLYSLEDPHKVSGMHFRELGLLPSMPLWGRLTHENGPFLDTLRQDVSEVKPDLIVVDTMNVALDWDDMNSMVETTNKMAPLRALARGTNATIILLAHTRKTSTGSALDILGSTGLRAATDTNIVYHHDEETDLRYLGTEGKAGVHFKHTPIALEAGRCSLGKHSHLSPLDSAMLQVLTVEPGGSLSHTQWLKACKMGTREKRKESIARLQGERVVVGKRGEKSAMYYTPFIPEF